MTKDYIEMIGGLCWLGELTPERAKAVNEAIDALVAELAEKIAEEERERLLAPFED